MKRVKIRNKVVRVILTVSLSGLLLLGSICGGIIISMKQNAVQSMQNLNRLVLQDSTIALQQQKLEELQALAENKGSLADTSLQLILNQTRLVAMTAEDIFTQLPECAIDETDLTDPQLHIYDYACAKPESIGSYSIHIRTPEALMEETSLQKENDTIVQAELALEHLIDWKEKSEAEKYRSLREYYLAAQLKEVLGGIRNFDKGSGSYQGIGATYFCLESSGIDILADTLTMPQIEYDARNSAWYQAARQLKKGEVYWSGPVMDASGRGTALVCAMPVYVGDRLIGVAGSGGLLNHIREMVESTTIGDSGYAFLVNETEDGIMNLVAGPMDSDEEDSLAGSEISQYRNNLMETQNKELQSVFGEMKKRRSGIRQIILDETEVLVAYSPLTITNWTMVTVIGTQDLSIKGPVDDLEGQIRKITQSAIEESNFHIALTAILCAVVILIILLFTVFFSYRFSDRLTGPIVELRTAAGQISSGNFEPVIDVQTGDEIQELGEAFCQMTANLKEYMKNLSVVTAEKERIGAELHVAARIQASMLPCIFPPFPEKKECDIYAMMQPAKEVGGDFYDFFLIDERHLAVVMADVSGKGVPAALFMVIAKTLIKNHAQGGENPAEVLYAVNNQLCESNEAMMFVTAWLGILELATGRLTYANAGHNPPLLQRKGGNFDYLDIEPGFVLAAIEGTVYKQESILLGEGDMLYLYTDGVTETMNPSGNLYGEARLQQILSQNTGFPLAKILLAVSQNLEDFAQGEAQFDDITMLLVKWTPPAVIA